MKILFIGDIFGKPGREVVKKLLPQIKKEEGFDLVFANAENAAGGLGITPQVAKELLDTGLDLLTSGDHIWDRKEILQFIKTEDRILRPANFSKDAPGRGARLIDSNSGLKAGVINILGRVFMNKAECPFKVASSLIEWMRKDTPIILIDFHAEATSEKVALGWFLDGKVSSVLGTHTHIQTADERILPGGTAYITDVGMSGPYDSVIGCRKEEILEHFLTQMPTRFRVAKGDVRLCGVILEIEPKTGKATSIRRIQRRL